ncbi:MAG: phosphatidylglycerophosphatase A [Gammaproteobacteria bacterium]|nr:phosphatidylglycerophosphatase A [Gammaproteobacteria bacterium]
MNHDKLKPGMKKPPIKLLLNPVHLCSLGFGTGYSPKAPGTMGTMVGVLIYLLIRDIELIYYLVLTMGFLVAGILMCRYTSDALKVEDHPAIVWDEIVGYLITMCYAPVGWWWALVGFVLFRFFDILKPWPVNLADIRVKGGIGIMLDDVIAGIYSLAIMQIIAYNLYR